MYSSAPSQSSNTSALSLSVCSSAPSLSVYSSALGVVVVSKPRVGDMPIVFTLKKHAKS